jgi:hypothetical protein
MLQEIDIKNSNKLGPKLKRAMAFMSSRELIIVFFYVTKRVCEQDT